MVPGGAVLTRSTLRPHYVRRRPNRDAYVAIRQIPYKNNISNYNLLTLPFHRLFLNP